MKIHALMSWYDEPVELLIASIASLKEADVDHLVCCDGAYALYPDGKAQSHPNQHAAIVMTCRELGIALTLHTPSEPWEGNEAGKRTALFALGWALGQDGDWFLIHDADTVITRWPYDVRTRLEQTEAQAATVDVLDVVALRLKQPDLPPHFEYCGLFRAQPITVGPHHAVYTDANGQALWTGNGEPAPVPALDLTKSVRIEHRPDRRPVERQQSKLTYYTARDGARIERGDCSRCGEPSVGLVPTRWRWTRLGPVGDWAEACEPCGERLEKVNRRRLMQMGVDPDSFVAENRNGKAPTGMTA